jgi:hypothetical protein
VELANSVTLDSYPSKLSALEVWREACGILRCFVDLEPLETTTLPTLNYSATDWRDHVTTTRLPGDSIRAELGSAPTPPADKLRALIRRRWVREIVLVVLVYGLYEIARALVSSDLDDVMRNGFQVLRWEDALHLDPEHALNDAVARVTALAVLCGYFYAALHYLVTPTVLVWIYRRHAYFYGRARNWLIASTMVGLIGYITVPTAPPRLLPGGGFHDTLAAVQNYGWWGNEASVPRGFAGFADPFAAMPSLHVGWALWCGTLIWRFARDGRVRALGVLYPVATSVVVMATANHYFFDALAGAVTMGIGAALAWGLLWARNRWVLRLLCREHGSTREPDPATSSLAS